MGKKPIVSVTYENERISIKKQLNLKCVLRLSCVVHGPIYGRFIYLFIYLFIFENQQAPADVSVFVKL